MSQSPHCNSTRDGFHNSHMLQSEQHVALSKYVYAYVCIKWMHPSPLCILFMHKLPGSGGSEVLIYRVLHSKEGEAHLCLHVWVCASNLCFDAWPACKAVQREISLKYLCVISCFFVNTLLGLKDSFDWFCATVPAIESSPNLHTWMLTAAFYWSILRGQRVWWRW